MTPRPEPRRAPGPVRARADAETAAAEATVPRELVSATEAVEATLSGLRPPAAGTVRATVDVSLAHHRRLNRLADDVAEDLGVASVTRQDLLAAAVAELLERDAFGDQLRVRVTARVQQLQQARE